MPNDAFYQSAAWRALREATLRRDGYRCVVPGCGQPAVVVDHIVSRRKGGSDALHNLRSLCRTHDNRVKERADGTRRGGKLFAHGCDASGVPVDPLHHWRA